jgi:hypothetical protein
LRAVQAKIEELIKMLLRRLRVFGGLVWLGMILGVSFVATPLKFQASSVTLAIGLDIGRLVFGVFNKIEIGLAVMMALLVLLSRQRDKSVMVLGVVWLALAVQTIWLLPDLMGRIQMIIQNQQPPPSALHSIYVGCEVVKALALAVYGFGNTDHSTVPGTKVYCC